MTTKSNEVREQVRAQYASAAAAAAAGATNTEILSGASVEATEGFGASLYGAQDHVELPTEAVEASLGCGDDLLPAAPR